MSRRHAAIFAAALIAIAAGAMALAGANPLAGFAALLRGALGGERQLSETLVQTTALLFPSLAVAFAFRAGLFNIGAEGQLIVGGLFVVETLSVVVQVFSFRVFHRRVLLIAPIHHHFEMKGWPEITVTVRFWILSGLLTALGLGLFYADFLSVKGK